MFRRKRGQDDFDDEIAAHLELEAERLREEGVAEEEARLVATRTFGNLTRARERFYESHRWLVWDHFVQDLRIGVRQLRKNPGFLLVAILTLGLGVGANTAIFSVVNAVLLSPLPYADPARLVLVNEVLPQIGHEPVTVSAPDIVTIQKLNHVFENAAGFRVWTYELSGTTQPERVTADRVSSNIFAVLGVQPILGRTFSPEEELPGHPVVVLGYDLWQRRFGGDRNILGATIALDRRPHTIIGVMPRSFVFPLPGMSQGSRADLWVPLALSKAELSNIGDSFDFSVVARLKPGIGLKQAAADLELVAHGILETYSRWAHENHMELGDFKLGVMPQPLADKVVAPARPVLLLLLGAVGFVLLIACVNVANLLLVRSADRQKEMAVRLAMGAGRARLFRQLLVEGMLLSSAGGGLGLAIAVWIKGGLDAALPASIPQFRAIELDLRVLLFTLTLAAVTGIAFGILPAFLVSRTNLSDALKESGRSVSGSREHHRMRAMFVTAEIALAVMLLVGAGLLTRSLQQVLETSPGFHPEHVLTASIDLPSTDYYSQAKVNAFFRQLMERLQRIPGAAAAGGSTDLPLMGGWTHVFTPEGYRAPRGSGFNPCYHSVIFGDYLQAMGIPLLRGRYFTEQDLPDSPHVLIISEALAKKYWPGQDPIGRRLKWGPPDSSDPWMTVVGVAGDVKQGPLEQAAVPHTYEPYVQLNAVMSLRIAVRAEGDPASLSAGLRSAVWSLDPRLAFAIRTMEQVISRSTATRRFSVFLLGSFATLALALSAIGIYGIVAYAVTLRSHEIGLRMALGAGSGDIIRLVLAQGVPVMAIGLLLGLTGALGLTRLLETLLYGIGATDPATFAAVLLLLGATALAASCIPARRALRIEPATALRRE